MGPELRVIRGNSWARELREQLGQGATDTVLWMEQNTRLLKHDDASRVGLLQVQGRCCCLKLYLPKSPVQRYWFRLGRGRAVHSFDMGSALQDAGLPVARPLACLAVEQGMLLLTAGIPAAVNLQALWQAQPGDDSPRQAVLDAAAVLARLHRSGYAHGDCKWPNLLWSGGACWLVDLDAATVAPDGSARQARDLARFILNAEELAVDRDTFEDFLQAYLGASGQGSERVISRTLPVLHKLRARHLARYGSCGSPLLPARRR